MFTAPSGPDRRAGGVARRARRIGCRTSARRTSTRPSKAATRLGGRSADCPDAAPERRPVRDARSTRKARRFGIHASGVATDRTLQRRRRASSRGTSSRRPSRRTSRSASTRALFDWDEISQTDMGPMGMYLIFGRNGRQLGGMFDQRRRRQAGRRVLARIRQRHGSRGRRRARQGRARLRAHGADGRARAATASRNSWTRTARSSRCTRPPRKGAAAASSGEAPARKPAKKAAAKKPAPRKAVAQEARRRQAAAKKRPAKKKPATSARPARKTAAQ